MFNHPDVYTLYLYSVHDTRHQIPTKTVLVKLLTLLVDRILALHDSVDPKCMDSTEWLYSSTGVTDCLIHPSGVCDICVSIADHGPRRSCCS